LRWFHYKESKIWFRNLGAFGSESEVLEENLILGFDCFLLLISLVVHCAVSGNCSDYSSTHILPVLLKAEKHPRLPQCFPWYVGGCCSLWFAFESDSLASNPPDYFPRSSLRKVQQLSLEWLGRQKWAHEKDWFWITSAFWNMWFSTGSSWNYRYWDLGVDIWVFPGLATAITLTALLTDAIKNVVGMPRPNFFHTCFPDGIPVLIHPFHTPLSLSHTLSLSYTPKMWLCLLLETLHKKANCCLLQCKQLCNMGRFCSCNSRTALTACSTSQQWKDGTCRCTILAWCIGVYKLKFYETVSNML
jgi:hypothetical protein